MRLLTATLLACLPAIAALPAQAAESGVGAYLLGLRNAGAGVTPPPGIYLTNQSFIYSGSIDGRLPTDGGPVPSSARVDTLVEIPTLTWVTPAQVLGGRLGLSATVPFGSLGVKGNVGPIPVEDSVTTFADPILTGFLGWRSGNYHWQIGVSSYMPWGDYRYGELANIAKHRQATDVQAALTYLDPAQGIDVTNAVGFTFNAENNATHYRTGDEFHWDWGITKKWSNGVSLGVVGYFYRQLTPDSGDGAVLGDFEGEVASVGASIGYDYTLGKLPVTSRLRYYHELDVENRLQGDAVFLSTSLPLWVDTSAAR